MINTLQDMKGLLDPWLLSLWKSLNEINPSLLPRVSDINDSTLSIFGDPKVHVIYYSPNEVPQDPILSVASFSVMAVLQLTLSTFRFAAPYCVPCNGAPVPRHERSPVVDRKFQV